MILPQCRTTNSSQNQVVVRILLSILDGNILEQTAVFTKDVIRLGYNLMSNMGHDPRPDIPHPESVMMEEIIHHVFQDRCYHCRGNGLVLIMTLRGRQVNV